MKKNYNKLIRDRIPEIIHTSGNSCKTRSLTEEEYFSALKEKLQEEVAEYLDEPSIEELADMMEVIYALSGTHNSTVEVLERTRIQKKESRGGFFKRLFLESVEIND